MIFILGLIVGLLLAIIVFLSVKKYDIAINRTVQKVLDQPFISSNNKSYIAGMSDEESSFAESLPLDKEVKIL